VVFAVLNLPGSNNDLDAWTNGVGTPAEQQTATPVTSR
jgi:hypothetical protein